MLGESSDLKGAAEQKLNLAIAALSKWLDTGVARKGSIGTMAAYRCRTVYQIVWETGTLKYAKRVNHKVVPIKICPIANKRIRGVMESIRDLLIDKRDDLEVLVRQLDAISFSTAWDDAATSDCLVTFHYSSPIDDLCMWKCAANRLRKHVGVNQITGRSRKRIVRALDDEACVIRDTLHISSTRVAFDNVQYAVDIGGTELESVSTHQDGLRQQSHSVVHYSKPEGAFLHPNADVMCRALAWILSRVASLCSSSPDRSFCIAELYCGFGAHTLAIRQAGICNLVRITAVELDQRLIEALHRNVGLNTAGSSGTNITRLDIVQGDAGKWARRQLNTNHQGHDIFDMLLVDPPRQGLDMDVTRMLLEKTDVRHCLYVSCGTEALVRDLGILQDEFCVKDCLVLDLFPQTSAVETLLHLERKHS